MTASALPSKDPGRLRPGEGVITEFFARQVAVHGDRLAVEAGDSRITYAGLDRFANRVAHAIDAHGARCEGAPVALLAEAGPAYLAGLLGTLKSGRAYLPLDPYQPAARQSTILSDSDAGILLCDAAQAGRARMLGAGRVTVIEAERLDGRFPDADPGLRAAPGDPAYVLYTSGSTGTPKGVVMSHRAVVHNAVVEYDLEHDETDRAAMFLSPAHGLSASLVFCNLLRGASVMPFDLRRNGLRALADWLQRERISLVKATPSIIRHLLEVLRPGEALPDLRYLWLGGEPLYARDVARIWPRLSAGGRIVSGMSATETKSMCRLVLDQDTELDDGLVPVGWPVAGKHLQLKDADGREVAPGEVGELWVRSRYLATGYWQDPELTRERFLPAPGGAGETVFRTGDVGFLRPDGALVLSGRRDDQLKIRGFRVQPAEAERALRGFAQIKDAAVVAEILGDERRLAAYVVSAGPALDAGAIRSRLTDLLPEYLVPARIVELPALPLSSSGKIDRVALAGLHVQHPAPAQEIPGNSSDVEKILLGGARDLLKGAAIGLDDDFRSAGGDSLRAVALLAWCAQVFHVQVTIGEFFAQPTLSALAARIDAGRADAPATTAGNGYQPVIPLAQGRDGLPIFLVPGGGGGEIELFLSYGNLVRELGRGNPVFGLRPSSPDGRESAGATVEAMAEAFAPAIRSIQPHGPYVLLGECYGGVLAFELARRLSSEGAVVIPVLLDTRVPRKHSSWSRPLRKLRRRSTKFAGNAWQRARFHWRRVKEQPRGGRLAYLVGRLRAAPRLAAENWSPGLRSREAGLTERINAARRDYKRALFAYRPQPFAGSLHLVMNESFARHGHARSWRRYARGGTRVWTAPGDHLSAVRAHAAATARVILDCVGESTGRARPG